MLGDILRFLESTGFAHLLAQAEWWKYLLMYVIIGVLFYLAIVKKFEPLLLLPISFGMLLANLPGANLMDLNMFFDEYYVSFADLGSLFTENGALIEDLAVPFKDALIGFVQALGENGFAYTITEGKIVFEESVINNPEFISLVESYLGGYVHLSGENLYIVADCALRDNVNAFMCAITNSDFTYQIVDGKLLFDKSVLSNGDFINTFTLYLGDAMTVNSSGFHIKMSTMILEVVNNGGLIDILYLGVKLGIYPSLIFLGVGAMTDFTPLIANPKSLLMGAGAQFGVFAAFFFALFLGFTPTQAGAIGIIGGADGPTAILVTKELAPKLLGAIAIAAYSYMALIPIIQPPIMRLLTTKRERMIKMTNLRTVSKTEKVIFPIIVTMLVVMIVKDAAPLIGFLMLGNLLNVIGVTDRLSKTAQNELINIVTIFLGISVGATANAQNFLSFDTIKIIVLGLCAFALSTVGGLIVGKIMCKLTGGKINPLIGAAGVSAVPMAARVAQDEGRKADPSNFLLMHAMGPNVAGVIGSAVAAGVFLSFLRV